MSKMTREEKLFRNESNVLEKYKAIIERDASPDETKAALVDLTHKYQTRFLTWISGRLERKLHRTNRELVDNNRALQITLDDLTKAEAGRSVYTIIYFIAIALFVLEEFFVAPFINMFGDGLGFNVMIKLIIVLLLKASEGFIEKKVTRHRRAASLKLRMESTAGI
jgi:hypothetical protein